MAFNTAPIDQDDSSPGGLKSAADYIGYFEALGMVGSGLACIVACCIAVTRRRRRAALWAVIFLACSLGFFVLRTSQASFKPVIYLYPEHAENITVKLRYAGKLTATYPEYDEELGGWRVKAFPNGKLLDSRDGKEYSYLFWEELLPNNPYVMPDYGFVIPGKETASFLQELLARAGLKPSEYNEFIVYWYPQIKDFPFVQIAFAGPEYERTAPLEISPRPDSKLRVFIYFRKLSRRVEIAPQVIPTFTRQGFAMIEWGGTILP